MPEKRSFPDSHIVDVIRLMREYDVVELTVERNDAHLHLRRGEAGDIVDADSPDLLQERAAEGLALIRANVVGHFYRSPQPEDLPLLDVGQKVEAGQVVGLIETLGILNEVRAEVAGRVAEVLVEDGQAVDYGHPLFRIEAVPLDKMLS